MKNLEGEQVKKRFFYQIEEFIIMNFSLILNEYV
jgi:hypothetical protein